jgi:hypothetical protein
MLPLLLQRTSFLSFEHLWCAACLKIYLVLERHLYLWVPENYLRKLDLGHDRFFCLRIRGRCLTRIWLGLFLECNYITGTADENGPCKILLCSNHEPSYIRREIGVSNFFFLNFTWWPKEEISKRNRRKIKTLLNLNGKTLQPNFRNYSEKRSIKGQHFEETAVTYQLRRTVVLEFWNPLLSQRGIQCQCHQRKLKHRKRFGSILRILSIGEKIQSKLWSLLV